MNHKFFVVGTVGKSEVLICSASIRNCPQSYTIVPKNVPKKNDFNIVEQLLLKMYWLVENCETIFLFP